MSDALAEAKALSFRATDVLTRKRPDGTSRSRTLSREVLLRRPNAARIRFRGEGIEAVLWYDAGKLALQSADHHVYAQATVPPNIDDALDFVGAQLRMPMPLADILYSSPHDALISPETRGNVVGVEKAGGVDCRHLAFQDPVVDWEIWIREGESPLPVRLVIRYKLADGSPEADVAFSDWNLAAKATAADFTFKPAEGFRKIRIAMPAVAAPAARAAE